MSSAKFFMQSADQKMVYMSNGGDNFAISYPDFIQAEPNYQLPDGCVGVQWTSYENGEVIKGFWHEGVAEIDFNFETGWDYAKTYILNIAEYEAFIARKVLNSSNPFSKSNTVASAKTVAATLINNYYDTDKLAKVLSNTALDKQSATGTAVFFLQLVEAAMYTLNNDAPTPLIDAQLLPTENRVTAIKQIIQQKDRLLPVATAIKQRKQALLGLMAPEVHTIADVVTYVNILLVTEYPFPGDP